MKADGVTIRFSRRDFLWLEMSQCVFSWAEEDFGPLDEKYHVDTVSYDSAPIAVRAKVANIKEALGEIDPDQPVPQNDRLMRQLGQDAATSLSELPQVRRRADVHDRDGN